MRAEFHYLVFNSPPLDPIRHNIYRVNIFNIILLLKLKFPKFVENTTFEKHPKIWHAINLHFYAHSGEVDVRTPTFGKNILPQSSGIRATFHISWCIPHYFRGLLFWFCFWSSCRNQSEVEMIHQTYPFTTVAISLSRHMEIVIWLTDLKRKVCKY
jgi:hypothetical protein